MKSASGAALASVFAAAASSACCWLPLAALTLGVGIGGIGAAFERYRWPLLALSVVLLAVGWWLNERATAAACAPDGTCPPSGSRLRTFNRVVLVICAVGVALFAALPEILGAIASRPLAGETGARQPVQQLSADFPELRDAFNRDQRAVRLIVLLSPT
ncbi:MAG: hypothetical protein ABIP29_12200 [Candidatus Eisenbacteria bacterium]